VRLSGDAISAESRRSSTVGAAAAAEGGDTSGSISTSSTASTSSVNANGYLAAAELLLGFKMGPLAEAALQLAAGLKDASARLWRRTKLAAAQVAMLQGDAPRALSVLRELQAAVNEAGDEDVCALVATGDVHYEVGGFIFWGSAC